MLHAGAARSVINPPLGIRTWGFSSREGMVEGIESDLTVTSLVLSSDETKVAIIAVDLVSLARGAVTVLRERVGVALGIPFSQVLTNWSHTHSAPIAPDRLNNETSEQRAMQEAYQAMVIEKTVASAIAADKALQPARIASGWGESHIGVQRREMGLDGLVFLGEVPEGETDPAVGVIRIDDRSGKPIAILCSYGCHTVVVGPRSLVASPDYPGATRDVVEQVLGGYTLFLQACGGDIMPIGGMGYEEDCSDTKFRVGAMLAGEVIRVAADLRTHVTRGDRTSLKSGSAITLWPWAPVQDDDSPVVLRAISEVVAVDLIAFPPLAVAEGIRDEKHKLLAEAEATGDDRDRVFATYMAMAADTLVAAIKTGRTTIDFDIQAMRIGDLVIAGIGTEVFSGTGKSIKAQSPFAHTEVLGYTNELTGYLPRAHDFPPEGWQINVRYKIPDMFFQMVNIPVAIDPGSEQRIVDRTLQIINQLS